MSRIFLLNGHPDPLPERFCAGLAEAYALGARRSGHEVRRFDLGAMNFPVLRSKAEYDRGIVAEDAGHVQDAIRWADHIVIVFPIWMGSQPALLKALFEQVFRTGFVLSDPKDSESRRLLRGKSAHLIATMGMPTFAFRWVFGAHGVRAIERGLLAFSGVSPIRRTLIGRVETLSPRARKKWLSKVRDCGSRAR